MGILSTAPGKVVLLGEYCVLEGAPAIAMAVDRVVNVVVGPAEGNECTVSSNLEDEPVGFTPQTDGTVSWSDRRYASRYELLSSIIEVLASQQGLNLSEAPHFHISIDSGAFYQRDTAGEQTKFGLGSSAALTVALARGLSVHAGCETGPDEHWLSVLIDAHRRFQGGQGSGIDVAASQYGGVIGYSISGSLPRVDRLYLPPELQLIFVWCGHSASTPGMLVRLGEWGRKNPGEYKEMLSELGAHSSAGRAAIESGDCTGLLDAARLFSGDLSRLGRRAGLEIFDAGHTDLLAMANRAGLVYKPCGAGNGDLGVAMGMDTDATKDFLSRLSDSKYQVMNIAVNPDGARVIRS